MTPQVPVNSVLGIEELVSFATTIFAQVFSLFHHPTNPVPVSAAPALISTLQATPGTTQDHHTVIAAAVNSAASTITQ